MQIVMFAVNSADFVYLFFYFVFCLTIWNSICLPFCPLCGRVIGISSSSVFLMLRSFILYFYFYFHLFVLRARRVVSEKWSSLVFVLLCLVCRRRLLLLLLLLLSSVSIDKSYRIANCRRRRRLCCLDSRIMSQIDRGSCECDYFHIGNKS